MATKAEKSLLSFKFVATAAGLWFAWQSYKKKEQLAEAQMIALNAPKPVTSVTPLAIPTGESLPRQNAVTMQSPADAQLQTAQPTRPLETLVHQGAQKLIDRYGNINI